MTDGNPSATDKEYFVRRLARASDDQDRALRERMTALIAEAHAQQQEQGRTARFAAPADRGERTPPLSRRSPMLPEELQSLLNEVTPRRRLDDLILSKSIRQDVLQFIDEYSQAPLLRAHSLEPRHTILLIGPPGTGKTSLAAALATELSLPFLTVRYDGMVGSYLGETASRLQQIVDYVDRTPSVLFFDEFESVGKERSDEHETGEIKRVVSSLLMHLDALPTHCVVVCATNHPEMLDRAVWRRFEIRLELPIPSAAELREWFYRLERSFGTIGVSAVEFAKIMQGESFSEVEAISLDARRKAVLSRGKLSSAEAFAEAIDGWRRRRSVGGRNNRGSGANRKDQPGTRKQQENQRQQALLSPEDLVTRAEQEPR